MRPITLVVLVSLATVLQAQAVRREQPAGYLGVTVLPLNPETRGRYKIPAEVTGGVVLGEVVENSAAAKAGLRNGDVVVSFAGKPIRTPDDLVAAVRAHRAGEMVAYSLRRGTGTIHGKLTLGMRPGIHERREKAEHRAPERGNLDQRLDRAQREMEELKRKLQREGGRHPRVQRHPRDLKGWIAREERMLQKARELGERRKAIWHEGRLSALRELRDSGMELANPRLERIEKKLDAILELLRRNK